MAQEILIIVVTINDKNKSNDYIIFIINYYSLEWHADDAIIIIIYKIYRPRDSRRGRGYDNTINQTTD